MRAALKREGASAARRKIVVEHFNGRGVLATPAASWLQDAGLVRLPDGLRLYTSPFSSGLAGKEGPLRLSPTPTARPTPGRGGHS